MCRIIDQNIKKCVFDSLDFQNFPGGMPSDPHGRRGLVMTRSAARGPQKKNARGLQRWLEKRVFFLASAAARVHFFFCGPRAAERVITRPRRPWTPTVGGVSL